MWPRVKKVIARNKSQRYYLRGTVNGKWVQVCGDWARMMIRKQLVIVEK